MKWRLLGAVALSGLVVAAVLRAAGVLSDSEPEPALPIPRSQLRAGGLSLDRADSRDAKDALITRNTAEQLANAATGAGTEGALAIKAVVLARVADNFQDPPFHCLCWVVSLDPTGMAFYGPTDNTVGYQAGYSVVVIDARTGELLFWRTGGEPPK